MGMILIPLIFLQLVAFILDRISTVKLNFIALNLTFSVALPQDFTERVYSVLPK